MSQIRWIQEHLAKSFLDGHDGVPVVHPVHWSVHIAFTQEGAQIPQGGQIVSGGARDVLTPREVAERSGFSYHAILRAIRRGDLQAFEPVVGHYRIEVAEYERWLHTPARRGDREPSEPRPRRRATATAPSGRGSLAALRAIEAKTG